jgi:hypothetical protein
MSYPAGALLVPFWVKTTADGQPGLSVGAGVVQGTEFRDVLEVTGRGRFHETCRNGVGSAKAFGFGLLVLAPISTVD